MNTVERDRFSKYVKTLLRHRVPKSIQLAISAPEVLPKPRQGLYTATFSSIDLFSGAGGLSIGLHAAGFNPVLAVEVNPDCCQTFAGVFPSVPIEPKPIKQWNFRKYEGVDIVIGGPPCQPFSSGGKGLAADDDRDMLPEFFRAVEQARPNAFLMENVPALFGSTHRGYLDKLVGQLSRLGYMISESVLNAAEYGAPQKRRRGFLVGMRKKIFQFPKPRYGTKASNPFVPAGSVLRADAVFGHPNDSKVFYAKNPDLRPSPYDGQLFNGGGRAIDLNAPCHTILASAGGNKTHFIDSLFLVPEYHAHLRRGGRPRKGALPGGRRLTPEESSLIQTFPPEMKFFGSRSSRYMQIGNAVPPLLAQAIGLALREQMR
jgi:DNA (cytosine-5)-methyltransferase 1